MARDSAAAPPALAARGAGFRLGIDIGGSKVALAVAGADGRLRASRRLPAPQRASWREDLAWLAGEVRALLADCGLGTADLASAGVAAPGPMDAARERLLRPPNLPHWDAVPLRAWLAEALRLPVFVENDANAAALAEWHYGAGRGAQDLVYLTLSTGVGGGIIAGGRLQRGARGSAGEFGHLPAEWQGEACACGLRGCFEAYLGGAAWSRRLARLAPDASLVLALAGQRDALRPEHVLAAAARGDAFARAELARWNHYLARLLVQVTFALDPERIVLGTIASAAGEALCLGPVRQALRAALWPPLRGIEVCASGLGAELPARAGLAVALAGEAELSRAS